MYRRCHWLRRVLGCEVVQTQPPKVYARVQLLRLVRYHANAAGGLGHRFARRRSHDGLQHVHRVWHVRGHTAGQSPARGAIGDGGCGGQTGGRGERRDQGQGRRARVEARPQGQRRGPVGGVQAARRWGVRVAARGRRARGRRVCGQPVQTPHAACGLQAGSQEGRIVGVGHGRWPRGWLQLFTAARAVCPPATGCPCRLYQRARATRPSAPQPSILTQTQTSSFSRL